MTLRERRQLHRVVEDEGRLQELRLDQLGEHPVDELPPALRGVRLAAHRTGELLAARPLGEIHADPLLDRVA